MLGSFCRVFWGKNVGERKVCPVGNCGRKWIKPFKTLKKEMDKQRLSVLSVARCNISAHTRMEIKPGSACKVLDSEPAC